MWWRYEDNKMSKKNSLFEIMKAFSLLSQLGLIVIVCIFGCVFFGFFLDKKFNTSPIFSIVFILLGIGSAFSGVYRTLKPFMNKRK